MIKLPVFRTLFQQEGYMHILGLLLLVAGIGAGVLLVSHGTNFIPQANAPISENSCRNNPIAPPEASASADYILYWKAECGEEHITCNVDEDCPQNTGDDDIAPEGSSKCFQFAEGNRCLKLKASRPLDKVKHDLKQMEKHVKNFTKYESLQTDDVIKTLAKAKEIHQKGITEAKNCLAEADPKKVELCRGGVSDTYDQAKASYRLLKFYGIFAGLSEMCVEADMGMELKLSGTSIDQHKEKRRLFFCAGKNNDPHNLNIKWRVLSKNGSKLVRTTEPFSHELTQFPNLEQIKTAKALVGLN